jgi:hypothetical protein
MTDDEKRALRVNALSLLTITREWTKLDALGMALAFTRLSKSEMGVVEKFIKLAENPIDADMGDLFMSMIAAARGTGPVEE